MQIVLYFLYCEVKNFGKHWPRGCSSVLMKVEQLSGGTGGIGDIHSFIK